MNRNRGILVAKFAAVLAVPVVLWAFKAGPNAHHTAVPGTEESSCNQSLCHVGTGLNAGDGNVKLTSSAATYTPGEEQTLTIEINDASARVYGFQLTARLASDRVAQAGSFTTTSATQFVLCAASRASDEGIIRNGADCPAARPVEFIEHNSPLRTGLIEVKWKAPATDVGPVEFYVSANAANGNGSEDGDNIYTASLTLEPVPSTPPKKPVISAGGIINAFGFGGKAGVAPGTWIEIYGSDFTSKTREWGGSDFSGAIAPNTLDKVTVTIAGKPAFVRFISPGQINVQVPDDIGTGPVPVVVTNTGVASDPLSITASATLPGLLAPANFKSGSTQYVVAQLPDNTFAGDPTKIAGTSRPVRPGETIVIYGIGFGPVSPSLPAGTVVGVANSLTADLIVRFGQIQATSIAYKGLGPNFVGLYQFNIVVPPTVPDGDLPLDVTIGGVSTGQTLFVSVKK